jgi:hypothetical protein
MAAIHPNGSVVGEPEAMLLLKVDNCGRSCGDSDNGQDCGGELKFEFLKHARRR